MNTSFVSARYKRLLGNGDLNPSVYTTGLFKDWTIPGEFWESSNHGSWISIPWTFVNILKISFYKPIKQTFKKNLLQISQ